MSTELPTVAGRRITTSNADLERAALVCLMQEQGRGRFSDSTLIHVLCEAVRLCREYTDHAGAAETKALVDGLRAELAAERATKEKAEARLAQREKDLEDALEWLEEDERIHKDGDNWIVSASGEHFCKALGSTDPPPIAAELERLRERTRTLFTEVEMHRKDALRNHEELERLRKLESDSREEMIKLSKQSAGYFVMEAKCALDRLGNGWVNDLEERDRIQRRAEAAEKERDGLREGFDALVKGTIAAKEKSNAELDKLRAKLQVARAALESVAAHRSEDRDGNHVLWIGETTFLQVAEALAQLDAEKGKANE